MEDIIEVDLVGKHLGKSVTVFAITNVGIALALTGLVLSDFTIESEDKEAKITECREIAEGQYNLSLSSDKDFCISAKKDRFIFGNQYFESTKN